MKEVFIPIWGIFPQHSQDNLTIMIIIWLGLLQIVTLMEQHALNNVNNCLNTNIVFYLETSSGQSSHLYLNFFNTSVN